MLAFALCLSTSLALLLLLRAPSPSGQAAGADDGGEGVVDIVPTAPAAAFPIDTGASEGEPRDSSAPVAVAESRSGLSRVPLSGVPARPGSGATRTVFFGRCGNWPGPMVLLSPPGLEAAPIREDDEVVVIDNDEVEEEEEEEDGGGGIGMGGRGAVKNVADDGRSNAEEGADAKGPDTSEERGSDPGRDEGREPVSNNVSEVIADVSLLSDSDAARRGEDGRAEVELRPSARSIMASLASRGEFSVSASERARAIPDAISSSTSRTEGGAFCFSSVALVRT